MVYNVCLGNFENIFLVAVIGKETIYVAKVVHGKLFKKIQLSCVKHVGHGIFTTMQQDEKFVVGWGGGLYRLGALLDWKRFYYSSMFWGFFLIFTKRDNFVASLDNKVLQSGVYTLKK